MADNHSTKKADRLLLLAFVGAGLVLAAALLLWQHFGSRQALWVRVSVDSRQQALLPLDTDTDLVITGYEGGTNHLVIQNRQALLTEADCPDKLCMGMGPISAAGQSMICLPHRVVIEIVSGEGSTLTGGGT